MKKIVLALTVAFLGTAMMTAQGQRHGQRGAHSPEKMIEHRINRLDKALDLTADQKKAITDIFKQEFEAEQAKRAQMYKKGEAMEKAKPSKEQIQARQEQMKARREASNAQIEKLLTSEQKAKFAQLKQEEMNHKGKGRAEHHGGKGRFKDADKANCKDAQKCEGKRHHGCKDKAKADCCDKAKADCDKAKADCDKAKQDCCKTK